MAESANEQDAGNRKNDLSEAQPLDTTIVQIGKTSTGKFTATQQGLSIIGTGNSAARATEDMARQIAEAQESGEL